MRIESSYRQRTRWMGVLMMAFALAACSSSPEAKSAAFIEAGKKLLENKDPGRAILQFRNATQATPKNAEAHYQLGLAYLAAGDFPNGIASLKGALELNPKHSEAQIRLALLMTISDSPDLWKDAQQRLQLLLEEAPDDANALHALALAELKLGEPEDAMQLLGRAIVMAPREVTIAATLAEVKLQQKDPKGAEDVLKKASENSPRSTDAVVMLGKFYVTQNRLDEAELQFQRAYTMDPNHTQALLNLATLQNQLGRKQEAEQSFLRLSSVPGKRLNHIHAVFLFQEGRRDEAIQELEKLAKADPEDRLARTRLIVAYRAVGRLPDAEKMLEQALKKNSKDLDALLQRGEVFLEAAKYGPAEADLNEVVRLQPNSAEARYIIAKLHQARGADLTYRQDLNRALELNPDLVRVRVELAQALVAGGDAKAALDLLDRVPAPQQQLTPVLVQRNWALWGLGDMAGMRRGIDRGLSRERSGDLLLQDGLWKLRANNFSGALSVLEEALKINPADVKALSLLNQAYLMRKQNAIALQKVEEYAARQPNSAPVQEFLGQLFMVSGDRRRARAAFEAALAADPKFVRANYSLIQTDLLDDKLDDAQRKLEAVLAGDQTNTLARQWLANTHMVKGNQAAAVEQFRRVVAAQPDNAEALNNLAYLLAEGGDLSEALKYAQKAKELAPNNAAYSDTLGWVLYRQGLYPLAVQELQRANAKSGEPLSKYHLAMAYAKTGDIERGQVLLQTALKQNPNLAEAKLAKEMLGPSQPQRDKAR